ncbi:MAG: hypothetical protein H7Z42_08050 [Roseiflexaceae bacterium]|nr:hypothetical protein [Roseiflexaceae bacterium]
MAGDRCGSQPADAGDDLRLHPTFLATRAITIQATPAEIWPWLIQMGYGRAGFYGYDLLENVGSARGMRSADRILPEFQHVVVGDHVPISAVARLVFSAIEPQQYLIWIGESAESPSSFTWALYRVDETSTRLVSRIRWSHHWTQPGVLAFDVFTEFADHIAVRKILQGVKDRVERRVEPMAQQHVEFALYVVAFLGFLAAVGLILLRPLTWRDWLVGLGAGAAWLITWYAPVSIGIGAVLNTVVIWGLIRGRAKPLTT